MNSADCDVRSRSSKLPQDGRLRSHGEAPRRNQAPPWSRQKPVSSALRRDRIGLLDRTTGWTIRDICASERERPGAIAAAAGIKLRGMVREGKQMSFEK